MTPALQHAIRTELGPDSVGRDAYAMGALCQYNVENANQYTWLRSWPPWGPPRRGPPLPGDKGVE